LGAFQVFEAAGSGIMISSAFTPINRLRHTRRVTVEGIVKLLGMIMSPDNSRHFPDAIATDPTLRQPALYQ
jgi:hypothetical protein